METYEINMAGTIVKIDFAPETESPLKDQDIGTATITVNGVATAYPYDHPTFKPLPAIMRIMQGGR